MGIRLLAGREFEETDAADSPGVAVVNQALVEKLLPGGPALGRRFRFGPTGDPRTIVGIVETGKYQSVSESGQLAVWIPLAQSYNPTSTLVARGPLPEQETLALVRGAIESLDPELILFDERPLADLLALPTTPLRLTATALSAMGALAVILSALGLHALVSYATTRRTREVGIRVALGARSKDVMRELLRPTLFIVGASAGCGIVLSFEGMRVLSSLLGANPDGRLSIAAAVLLAVVSLVAAWIPARRALAVEPLTALRYE
jgi:hypothetical protein